MPVISDDRDFLAHYPTGCAKNYYTKTFLKITVTVVRSDLFQTSSGLLLRASSGSVATIYIKPYLIIIIIRDAYKKKKK